MKTLVWDFDNTIGYREGAWKGTILEVLDAYVPNHEQTLDTIRPFLKSKFPWHNYQLVRKPDATPDDWWQDLAPIFLDFFDTLHEPERSAFLFKKFRKHYFDLSKWKLFPKAIETIHECANLGFRNTMLTNNVPEIETILNSLGVTSHFDTIWNSAVIGAEKPNPKAFEPLLNHYGPENIAYMIGDNIKADLEGASNFDIPCILVGKSDPRACHSANETRDILNFLTTS